MRLIRDHSPYGTNPLLSICKSSTKDIESKQMDFDHLVNHMLRERHGSEFYTGCIIQALPFILKTKFPLKIEALRTFFLDVQEFK